MGGAEFGNRLFCELCFDKMVAIGETHVGKGFVDKHAGGLNQNGRNLVMAEIVN